MSLDTDRLIDSKPLHNNDPTYSNERFHDSPPMRSNSKTIGDSTTSLNAAKVKYKLYRWRWYIIIVAALYNGANALLWITFSPIADLTALYYGITLSDVNFLSLVYIIAFLPFSLCSAWIVDTLGLRISIISGAGINALGSIIRVCSTIDDISESLRFPLVMTGQTVSAIAQPIALIIPVKIASLWFPSDQRAIATSIASLANPLAVMIMNILSPQLLAGDASRMFILMVTSAALPVLVFLMAVFGVCRSVPQSPPSSSACFSKESFFKGLKEIVKSGPFWVICINFGVGVGAVTSISTLIQQILCPHGYSDQFAGLCGALYIGAGVVISIPAALIVDKWKCFVEVAKVFWALAGLSYIGLAEVFLYGDIYVVIAVVISLSGICSLTLYPISLELAVETTYPVAEATSSCALFFMGQVFSLLLILCMQSIATEVPMNSPLARYNCSQNTSPNLDYKYSNLTLAILVTIATLAFIIFYHCEYRRLNAEKRVEAQKILSYSSHSLEIEPENSLDRLPTPDGPVTC